MKKNSFYTIGSLIILLICAFVFVILPAMTGKNGNQNTTPAFGKYDGTEIRYEQGSDMAEYVSNYGQMLQAYGQQIDQSTYFYIFNYGFNAAVTQAAYRSEVKRSGYSVPEGAVNRALLPYFSDEKGNYSSKLYKQTPESTIQDLRKRTEANLVSRRYYEDLFGSSNDLVGSEALYGIKESEAELDFLNDICKDKRGFDLAVFPTSDYPEEKVVEYGKANAAKFTKYDLSIITCKDKSTAEKLLKRINNGEITFADAISEYSEKNYSNSDGKMYNTLQHQIEKLLADKADINVLANLTEGNTTDIIETEAGFSIFHADGNTTAADMTADETIKNVSAYLKAYEKGIIEDYFVAKAKDFQNDAIANNFDSACDKAGIEKVTLAPFPMNYGGTTLVQAFDDTNAGIPGANTNENFLKTIFGLNMNEVSAPIVIDNNVVVVKYTTSEVAEEDAADLAQLTDFDETALQNAILSSPKLENNFTSVYFEHYMN